MNTTEEFLKSISYEDNIKAITQNFDELMTLYHIIGNRGDIQISASSTQPISFELTMKSKVDAARLSEYMNGLTFIVYGEPYNIAMEVDKKIIHTVITKASK